MNIYFYIIRVMRQDSRMDCRYKHFSFLTKKTQQQGSIELKSRRYRLERTDYAVGPM